MVDRKVMLVWCTNYCENVVDIALLLFLLNLNCYDFQVRVFKIFIRVVKIGLFNIYIYIYILVNIYIHFFASQGGHPCIYVGPSKSLCHLSMIKTWDRFLKKEKRKRDSDIFSMNDKYSLYMWSILPCVNFSCLEEVIGQG